MRANIIILMSIIFGIAIADYTGPQNGIRNGNGNGNSYGVPPDSIIPPQPQGGPYPPSGWKPSGRRLLLPGESRSAQQPIDSGYGQPLPPQYGPVNPSPSGPSIDSQYGPSVDNTGPPNNQYIPSTGFENGGNGGNGFSNGNGHNGNNGNGHGNGSGNGPNGGNGNGNGQTNNGNGHSGNGNSANVGNGFSNGGNGNKFSNNNGQKGSNGASNGNGNGNKGSNGGNGFSSFAPGFHGAFPGGVIYPFVQHSVPAVLAFRPANGAGHGSIYPIYQVPVSPSTPNTNVIASSFPQEHGIFPFAGPGPSFHVLPETTNLGTLYPEYPPLGTHNVGGSHQTIIALIGHGTGSHFTLPSNHQSQNSNILGVKSELNNLQLQYTLSNAAYGNGVPLGVF